MTAVYIGFALFILAMLALDLFRKPGSVSLRESIAWSCAWVGLALLFALGIVFAWDHFQPAQPGLGGAKALEFLTGYVVELVLSVDNLFVFIVIFQYFGVPEPLRHRALVWGIVLAILLRIAFILAGTALLHWFAPFIYVFGALLLYTAYKLLFAGDEEVDPEKNVLLRVTRRLVPVVSEFESTRFVVIRDGRRHITPLALVLVVIGSTDLLFAVDSIPAVFGITRDPFIVTTSNIFAVLGLRSFYFAIAGGLAGLRYLKPALALVLGFVGVKMIAEEALHDQLAEWGLGEGTRILISLGVVVSVLGIAFVASYIAGPVQPREAKSSDEAPKLDDNRSSAERTSS